MEGANRGGLTSSNIHDDYLMWCQRNSRFDINHIGYRELMKRLKEVPGEWEKVFCTTPFRPTGNQQRRYSGISRRKPEA